MTSIAQITPRLLTLVLSISVEFISVRADEFHDLSAAFVSTRTLAGFHHATTSNPDGSSINFWTPASEGSLATSTSLSNPHMAAADAAGNIYIADKASHAVLIVATNGTIRTFAGTHVGASTATAQRWRPPSRSLASTDSMPFQTALFIYWIPATIAFDESIRTA